MADIERKLIDPSIPEDIADAIREKTGSEDPIQVKNLAAAVRGIPVGNPDAVLYTPQTLTSSQQAQARENIGAGEDNVFVAEYGVTTWDEVQSALNAGKVVVAKRDNLFYYPIAINSTQVRFSAVQSPVTIRMIDCRTTGWAVYGNSPLQIKNIVTSLSASSTDTQYPSAACVWNLIGDVESLLAAI